MFTAEELEECDIFPKKITIKSVLIFSVYAFVMICACILMYSFYSGRDFISLLSLESMKFSSDNYVSQKLHQLDSRTNYDQKDKYYVNITDVPPSTFIKEYVAKSLPAIFRNSIEDWKAFQEWKNIEYLKEKLKDIRLFIEERKDPETVSHVQEMKYAEFIEFGEKSNRASNYYIDNRPLPENLHSDISFDKFPLSKYLKLIDISFSQGLQEMTNPGHTDNYEKIWCQITGGTDIVIIPALFRNTVYPYKIPYGRPGYSAVNFFKVEYGRFPNFRSANRLYISLSEGDCIYLPAFWWYASKTSENIPFMSVTGMFESHSRFAEEVLLGIDMDFQ